MRALAGRRTAETVVEDVSIESLSHDGRGIARVNGKTVFVEGALPGERVSLQFYRRRRDYDEARIVTVGKASPDRVEPRCRHFGTCGGCVLQHLAPAAQLAAKQQTLLDNLRRIGRVEPETLMPPLHGPAWGYRRRARLSARLVTAKGRVLVGFVERGKSSVTDIRRCEILDPRVGALIQPLSELLGGTSIPDRIPQVELAVGDSAIVLVVRILRELNDRDRARFLEFEQRHGVCILLQTGQPDDLEAISERPRLSYGIPEWGVDLEFQPVDFIQVNAEINRSLIARAMELLELEPSHRVLDLFCGLGNFTLPLARAAKSVVGVEGDAGLIHRARLNAERNGIGNVQFYRADLFAEELPVQTWMRERYDRVLLDPPRAGAREIIANIDRLGARRLVYVSCHPATLARDAGLLVGQHNFHLISAGVLDMFPHTAHVESIAVFERN